MNVIVLHGSAHRGGDTDTLADRFLEGLADSGPHVVTHFVSIDMDIAHCRACLQCAGGDGCVIDDDMRDVYPAFTAADVVVLATPMFWGYMTSQLKTLFDRLEAIVCDESFGGKEFVLLGGYRQYYGSMIAWLDRIATLCGSRSHAVMCQTYDPHAGRDIPIRNLPDKLAEAFDLGRRIGLRSNP